LPKNSLPAEKGPHPGALVIALTGVLRWREKPTVLSATGASQDKVLVATHG